MKKAILFIGILSLLFSCESDPDFFSVSGKIKNANGEKLYLAELKSDKILMVDSIILNNEGVFSFKRETQIPKFYALRISNGNYLTLIINPYEKIEVEADGRNLSEYPIIVGSPESEKIAELREKLEKSIDELDSLAMYYKSLIGTREIRSVRDSVKMESEAIIQNHANYTKRFIEENYNSLSGLMALYQQIAPRRYVLNPQDDFSYFEMVDTSLMRIMPESDAVITLHRQIQEIKRQKKNKEQDALLTGEGVVAPDIVLPNPQGDTIALSSLKGKYVLLDFWASWCRPCRIENPNLVKSYQKYKDKGFEIFQVSLDKKKDAWLKAIENDKLDWVHVSDLQYWNSSAAQLYNIKSIPASFLLDKNGVIIAKNLRGDLLEAKLSEIFD